MSQQLTPEELQKLLNRVAARDDKAYEELVRLYQNYVYRFIRKIVWDDEGAADVMHDTFMEAIRKPHDFKPLDSKASYTTWLCKIAENKALDWKRRMAQRNTREEWLGEEGGESIPDERDGPFEAIARASQQSLWKKAIEHCLAKLSAKQAFLIDRVFYGDTDQKTLANELGVSEGTVKSRMFYARKDLHECLQRNLGVEALNA